MRNEKKLKPTTVNSLLLLWVLMGRWLKPVGTGVRAFFFPLPQVRVFLFLVPSNHRRVPAERVACDES